MCIERYILARKPMRWEVKIILPLFDVDKIWSFIEMGRARVIHHVIFGYSHFHLVHPKLFSFAKVWLTKGRVSYVTKIYTQTKGTEEEVLLSNLRCTRHWIFNRIYICWKRCSYSSSVQEYINIKYKPKYNKYNIPK